jgi:predicted  nucleic acid-binding Zn-ribbon protein
MKILKISLENFRQFEEAEIYFGDGTANSTGKYDLVIGANTSGKSTFMASIMFAFHGSSELLSMNPDMVPNDAKFHNLESENYLGVAVTVDFTHGPANQEYRLRRYVRIQNKNGRPVRLEEQLTLVNTTTQDPVTPPERWVNRNFPKSLVRFLLFPGERAQNLLVSRNLEQIQHDIKALTELDRIEPLVQACESVMESIEVSLKRIPDKPALTRLIDKITGTSSELAKAQGEKNDTRAQLELLKTELRDLDSFLQSKAADVLRVHEIETHRSEIARITREQATAGSLLTKFVGEYGWLVVFGSKANEIYAAVGMDLLHENGHRQWPSALLNPILEQGICLCGRHLDDVSREWISGSIATEDNGHLIELQSLAQFGGDGFLNPVTAIEKLQELQKSSLDLSLALEDAKLALSKTLSQATSSSDESEIQKVSSRKIDIEDNLLPSAVEAARAAAERVSELEIRHTQLNEELSKLNATLGSEYLIIEQRTALRNVITSIQNDANNFKEDLRTEIQNSLQERLPEAFAQNNLLVHVTEDFKPKLYKFGAEYNMADGEVALLGFSYVAALYKAANEIGGKFGMQSNPVDFPIVLDAPFSLLGDHFIEIALEILSSSFSQIILMLRVSDSVNTIRAIGESQFRSVWQIRKYMQGNEPNKTVKFGPQYELPVIEFGSSSEGSRFVKLVDEWQI